MKSPLTTPTAPTGEQWSLRLGDQEAVIAEVGGTLRSYTVDGRPLVSGFEEDEECDACRGQVLVPWPNRIRDGVYTVDGEEHQLALTEPERHNAIHGLVCWSLFDLLDRSQSTVTVGTRLRPQKGWSWSLDVEIEYALGDDGLTVTPLVVNVGEGRAPFAFGAHPYLTAGETHVDQTSLSVPAAHYLQVDPERLLPVRDTLAESLAVETDFRGGECPLAGLQLDRAYTGLVAGADGRWRVRLAGPERAVTLWADATAYPWLQVFTGDALPEADRRTTGVAVEPLTAGPNAFVTGEGVLWLEPGEDWSAPFGICPE
ncbi:aldose 1-epimerase family protein [Arsenicicoccus piscis]|uniref:Aldose 1-epimerase n=1 Tax=Arsenicicoccus piscis TaxID=673954 RepID=A0ABQ6HSP7_9MICO|nr:aldose 1-epimerase family protein [Arsenicicoccus piscis]MCH8627955.1 aldose 1-epimerase family protein [Arsenicicoccus piscis]GMA20708.1 aldose 1-epimerase [Arsenicicoccus piscis]